MGQRMVDVAVMRQVLLRTCDRCDVAAAMPAGEEGGTYLPYTPAEWMMLLMTSAGAASVDRSGAQFFCSPGCLVDAVTERMERGSGG